MPLSDKDVAGIHAAGERIERIQRDAIRDWLEADGLGDAIERGMHALLMLHDLQANPSSLFAESRTKIEAGLARVKEARRA